MILTGQTIQQTLAQNDERNAWLFQPFNPYTGEGSLIERREFFIDKDNRILLPWYLYDTSAIQNIVRVGTLRAWADKSGLSHAAALDFLNGLRLKYDFEFCAATCFIIHDKTSGKEMPFVLRLPQRLLLKDLTDQLFSNKPVREIILKARQWGGSTLVDLWEAWIQIYHKTGWNSCIAAHVKDAARNIRAMYSLMIKRHPKDVMALNMVSFEGSQTTKKLIERDAIISIGTAQKPESLRSLDIKLVHASEVGLWKDTKEIKAEDLAQALVASVPIAPYTAIILESTAKGTGNYFERMWHASEKGESIFKPIFIPWFYIDIYWKPFADEKQKRKFVESMTPAEWERWNLGATLEGLHWYREMLATIQSEWRMMSEFPSTPQEAFATSGRLVHNISDINFMRNGCKQPLFVGEMVADSMYGKEAIDASLRFAANPHGDLWLWAMPDKSRNIRNRYVVSMDIGGRSDDADWTVISVIDRYMMMFGGVEECIGTYRFHKDQDLAVWKAVQVAKFYNDALLAVEFNSLNTLGTEGDHTYTILDQIVDMYPNIYYRDDPTKVREGLAPHYGFHTNRATKQDLITNMQRRLRDKTYIERDARALDECAWYEQKDKRNEYGAKDGEHDDIYMSRAIGLKVSSVMDMPSEVEQYVAHGQATIRTAANI